MTDNNLYPTNTHDQHIAHFASIVRIALTDNKIDKKERKLLEKLARRLGIDKLEFKLILKNPKKYPLKSPVSYEERLEELYDLTKMLLIDRNPTIDKISLLDRIIIGLGFHLNNVKKIRKEAIKFFLKEPDLEDFKKAIKKANPMKH